MVEKRFEKLGMPDIERFENYLPTAFNSELTLLQKVNKIIFDLIETNKLTNEMVDYLNRFIETFDEKLYETLEDVLNVWLEDGRLADIVRVAISEEVIEARTDYLGKKYVNLKERLDSEKADVVEVTTQLAQIAVNVMTLGVKPNDSSTSSLINTFIAEQTGEPLTLFFPEGSYLLTETIVLKENISIVGSGVDSTIFYTNTEITNFFNLDYEHFNVTFKDLALLGSANQNVLERGIFLLGTSKHANVVITNCKFKNLTVGIQTGANGLAVSHNIFENITGIDSYGHAILCVTAKNITVENNYFVKVKRHCIYFSAGTKNSRFVNNTCLDSNGNAVRLNAYLHEGHASNENITIQGNLIDGVKPYDGQTVDETSIIGGLALTGFMENITMTDNIIKNVYNSFIYINSLPDYDGPFLNVVISNNVLKNSVVSGVKLNVTGGKNVTIANNIIDDFIAGYGMRLSDVESGGITNNIIKTGGMFSIKLFANTSKISVSKNQTTNEVSNESLLNSVYLKLYKMDDYLGADLLELRNHVNSLIANLKNSGYMTR